MVVSCHGEPLRNDEFSLADYGDGEESCVCPRCKKRVTLIWDVRLVTEGDDEPQ
jgi:hypothetical protein